MSGDVTLKQEHEQMTSFLAREKGAMLRFVEQVQKQLSDEMGRRNKERMASYHAQRLSYLSALEEFRAQRRRRA